MTVVGADEAERVWDRRTPHYELTSELLPRPDAPSEELVYSAGAFDETIVAPTRTGLRNLAADWRKRCLAGTLPAGLRMGRTLLHGEQRIAGWSEEAGNLEPEALRRARALVERIRELVDAGGNVSPNPATDDGVRDKVLNAFDHLVAGYADWCGVPLSRLDQLRGPAQLPRSRHLVRARLRPSLRLRT